MFDPSSPRSPRSSRPGSARPLTSSPRRTTSALGTRPSSAHPAELCDRYIRDMQSMQVMAAKGEVQMDAMDAYSFWELHKLKTQSRCLHRQDEYSRRIEAKRTIGPGSRNDWYVLTGSPRPNLRSQQWLNDDMRSNLGGPPYFPAPELGELQPFSTYKWNSNNGPRSRPQTPQVRTPLRTPQGSRPTTPRQTARPSVGFSDQHMSKADWVERANAMMTDEDKAAMQEAVRPAVYPHLPHTPPHPTPPHPSRPLITHPPIGSTGGDGGEPDRISLQQDARRLQGEDTLSPTPTPTLTLTLICLSRRPSTLTRAVPSAGMSCSAASSTGTLRRGQGPRT
jgi:hypothetical protein